MEKFELNITDLSEEEIPWVSSFLKCEEELESYDIQEKKHDSNYSMVNNYYKMLYMVLKYHNLRSDEIILNTPLKRMIKINRIVSSKEFTPMKVDFAAFNGICFPADVVFIDYREYEKYSQNPTEENKKKLNVIEDADLTYVRTVKFNDGRLFAVTFVKNCKGTGFIRKPSEWEYIVF